MDDNPDADEFLSWLCWMWAEDGERFYPPDVTASECTDAILDGSNREDRQEVYEREFGEHCRAYTEALDKFRTAERRGFDPVERAAREHRDLMEKSDGRVEPLDWSWYHE